MPETPLDREIESMVGDRRIARVVKESLEGLRSGHAGPEMAEMARDLLTGRIRMRDVTRSPAYAEALMGGLERYKQWEAGLTAEERRRFDDDVRDTYGRHPGDAV